MVIVALFGGGVMLFRDKKFDMVLGKIKEAANCCLLDVSPVS